MLKMSNRRILRRKSSKITPLPGFKESRLGEDLTTGGAAAYNQTDDGLCRPVVRVKISRG